VTISAPDPKPPYKELKPGEIRIDWIPSEWALTPLNGKRAYIPGWTSSPYTLGQIQEELQSGRATGIGLLTGQHCNEYGLIWLDLDGPEATPFLEELAGGSLESILPPTLTITSGKPGRLRLLYRISNENITRIPDKATIKIGAAPLELLWRSRQGAIMGVHPDTEGYSTTKLGGFEYAKKLPELPEWLYAAISSAYPSNKYRKRGVAGPNILVAQNINIGYEVDSQFYKEALADEIKEYLDILNSERADDYEEWLAVGMALHQCGDEFLEAWIEWSAQSDHFEDGCCEAKWASFERLPGGPSPEGARGLQTLRAKAKEDNYVDFGGFEVPSEQAIQRKMEEDLGEQMAGLILGSFKKPKKSSSSNQADDDEDDGDDDGPDYFGNKKKGSRNPPASEIADFLYPMVQKIGWHYDAKYDCYLQYNKTTGIWEKQDHSKSFNHEIQFLLCNLNLPNGYSTNLINDVCNLLQGHLVNYSWENDPSLLAFRNGVLEIDTGEFLEHDAKNYMTWGLDFAYDPSTDPGPIVDWLYRSQYGDQGRLQVLRAWLRACLVGKGNEIQRFLEVIGPGGRGKSTYANLCCALVGLGNYASTTLNQLEQSRFELSSIKGKRLTLINDSERYGGSAQTFKALTGGDSLRYEEKLKAVGEPFVYTGMVMVVANEPIQTTDNTSGLARRRLTIEFNRKLYDKSSEARDMIKIDQGRITGYWKDYLPGLVNWVLAMSEQEMRQYLLDTNEMVPSLRKVRNNILLNSNNLIEFLQSECVVVENHVSCVGKKIPNTDKEKPERYYNSSSHLYPSYCEYCESTGSKAVGQKRFINLLLDVCKNQLDLDKVSTFSKNGRLFFKGIAVRSSDQKFRDYPTVLSEGKETE
jgi:phage/plasmid-associated DNA primase